MSTTVGDIRKGVLHELREFSNSGETQGTADIKDYLLSIIPLLNVYQKELATSTHKIKRKFEIAHNNPINQLGLGYWEEEKVHSSDVDVSYSAQGSRAYSFQVSGRATVYIEEQIAGVWTNLTTITHTPTAGEGYKTYHAKTNVSNTSNMVRIRFSGEYRYAYRWVALFSDNYYSDDETPEYSPYVPYSLPSNWYQKDRIEYTHADRQYGDYAAYKFDDSNTKQIYINWYEKGEFIIRYYAYPTVIADPNPANPTALDSTALDVPDECAPALIHRIAAALARDENSYMADTFEDYYQIAKAELVQNDDYEQGEQGIILNSNW